MFSKKAEKAYQELGFTKDQAKEVVAWITADEFRKSIQYDDTQPFDDYLCPRKCPINGVVQAIYVKLRIPTPASVDYVYVTSFHTQRPLEND